MDNITGGGQFVHQPRHQRTRVRADAVDAQRQQVLKSSAACWHKHPRWLTVLISYGDAPDGVLRPPNSSASTRSLARDRCTDSPQAIAPRPVQCSGRPPGSERYPDPEPQHPLISPRPGEVGRVD